MNVSADENTASLDDGTVIHFTPYTGSNHCFYCIFKQKGIRCLGICGGLRIDGRDGIWKAEVK